MALLLLLSGLQGGRRVGVAGSRRQFSKKCIQLGVEVALSHINFGQGGLKAVIGNERKFEVVWRLLWVVVEGGLAAMEAPFGE